MKEKCPCYKCTKRHRACHGYCPDYIEWHTYRVYELAAKAAENIVAGYSVDANARSKKKANRR